MTIGVSAREWRASLYLPATSGRIGLTERRLPVGLQTVSAEGEDPTSNSEFGRLLAAEIGGFVPPPAYT